MQMDDPQLALELVDEGLARFDDQYDLMADKARALLDLGRAGEARKLLEEWRLRRPHEFVRSWRPAVFYTHAVEAGDLSKEAIEAVETVLEHATCAQPHQIKIWSTYAKFEKGLGRHDKAQEILEKALELNPFGQVLNYVYGELLLERGKRAEAVAALERAVQNDYQEQFQHDVNQFAVTVTLGQAYEAAGEVAKAGRLYRIVVMNPAAGVTVKQYAQNRLKSLMLLSGEPLEPNMDPAELAQMLARLNTKVDKL